jgi:hypothetical protein
VVFDCQHTNVALVSMGEKGIGVVILRAQLPTKYAKHTKAKTQAV